VGIYVQSTRRFPSSKISGSAQKSKRMGLDNSGIYSQWARKLKKVQTKKLVKSNKSNFKKKFFEYFP